jgi:hypothetical protein
MLSILLTDSPVISCKRQKIGGSEEETAQRQNSDG